MRKVWNFVKRFYWTIIEVMLVIAGVTIDCLICIYQGMFYEIVKVVFELLPIFGGFAVTCYLLFIELYKDRYPYKFVKSKTLPKIKRDLVGIVICLFFGLFVMIHDGGCIEKFFFIADSILTIALIVIHLFGLSNTMTISSYAEEYCNKLTKLLEKKENSIERSTFKDLKRVLEECIIKEEYSVARQISNGSGRVFKKFLENSIAMLGTGESSEKLESSFAGIVQFGMEQLSMCDEIDSELLVRDIVIQQGKNLQFCIEANQYEWFTSYIKEMTQLYYRSSSLKKDKVARILFELFSVTLDKLIDTNKNEWTRKLVDEVSEMTFMAGHISNNIFSNLYVGFITLGLIDNKDDSLDSFMFEKLERYTLLLNHYSNPTSEYIVEYYYYFSTLVKENDVSKINRFVKMIFDFSGINTNDSVWVEYKSYCVSRLIEAGVDKEIIESHQKELLSQIIDMKRAYKGGITLPNYKEKIYDGLYVAERIKGVCDDIEELFDRSIMCDNIEFYYYLMQTWKECISCSTKSQKDIQIELFNVYIWLINRTRSIDNRQFEELTFLSMQEVIEVLDNKNAISDAFGDCILERITNLARAMDSRASTVLLQSIELLSSFVDGKVVYRFTANKDKKLKVGKGIYNIAVNCIENDYEEGLRKSSNALGWFIVNSIKNSTSDLTKYLLGLSGHMYNIAQNMSVSEKTLTFLTTLFTTVGMFCCTDSAYDIYLTNVVSIMQKVGIKDTKTAIEMRTYENDMFEELFNGNIEKCSSAFQKKVEMLSSSK